jgi:MFS family permease
MNPESYDYSTVLSAFYVSYIIFEIPCNILCKRIGPGWFIPATTLMFGICSICTAFVQNMAAASGVRFLLGIFEAGMLPGIAYYLSRWYRRRELAFRLSLYIVSAPLAGAFGGLLASAILTLDHFGSLHAWRKFSVEYNPLHFLGYGLILSNKSRHDLCDRRHYYLRTFTHRVCNADRQTVDGEVVVPTREGLGNCKSQI